MTGRNKTPLLGWHPPAELSAWVRAEAEKRGVTMSALLNEIVLAYIRGSDGQAGLSGKLT